MSDVNNNLVLIAGDSATGKSASLMNMPDHKRVAYANCESGKRLPFKNSFQTCVVTDPYEVHQLFDFVTENPDFDYIIVDTITFLMEMYETIYIRPSTNGQQAWGDYADFLHLMMLNKVPACRKNVIFLGHNMTVYDEKAMAYKSRIGIKGAIGKTNGFESFFVQVVMVKKKTLEELEPYSSDLLHITPDDEALGYKHVFQTRLTKDTLGERIRAPMGMFTQAETFMDNDAALLMQRINDYYA